MRQFGRRVWRAVLRPDALLPLKSPKDTREFCEILILRKARSILPRTRPKM
jgi:hypothetical protein